MQMPAAQSLVVRQPQRPSTQMVPFELAAQLTQSPPSLPQAEFCLPAVQVPFRQHPPLQMLSADGLHAVPQAPFVQA